MKAITSSSVAMATTGMPNVCRTSATAEHVPCPRSIRSSAINTPAGVAPCARIVSLADVYDALTTKRVYKAAFSHEKAVAIIRDGRGAHFDPDIVDAFLNIADGFYAIAQRYADAEHKQALKGTGPHSETAARFHRRSSVLGGGGCGQSG